jgi:hypothetical protein
MNKMMNTTPITIEEGWVTIRPMADGVWLTEHEIARLFDVFVSAVGGNIRSILKSEVLREDEVCRRQTSPNGSAMTLYNMKMITALAFRLKSRQAEQFRQWIVRQALNPAILWKIPYTGIVLN